ncbi:hypothetical protein FRC00_004330 [Tulasnella sp. 408]|nr:hypothetical protein FRC00_004330 [Tulasnella sp. 408]
MDRPQQEAILQAPKTAHLPQVLRPIRPSINSFFSRLQSSLPPQLAPESITQTLQNIQKQVQPALANAQTAASTAALQAQHAASAAASQATQAISQVDVSQYQRSLSGNIRKLQEAQAPMLAQAEKLAEEARHRSEVLFKEAGEYLKDAVKVVPPEGGSAGAAGAWDGSDLWMYPSPIGTAGWGGNTATRAVEEDKPRKSGDTTTYARVTRADALLARLKHDPELVKLNPEADEAIRETYLKFVGEEIDGKGGVQGDVWSKKVEEALADGTDGPALKSTMDAVVPFEMNEETFWTRYFFRVHQIQDEEEKRKALLQGATTQEEDFTWDDEDESESPTSPVATKSKALVPPEDGGKASTPTPTKSTTPTPAPAPAQPVAAAASSSKEPSAKAKVEAASVPSSSAASPRESEESFDVVSAGMKSKDASSEGSEEEEDEDEDEEEEEEEEDDDDEEEDDEEEGEEEESGSDWE